MNSTIRRLVKYVSIFGIIDWLPEAEAEAKLERERKLYERWRETGDVQPPRIERS